MKNPQRVGPALVDVQASITVFGGTGFIGRHLVTRLLRSGATVRVAVRHPTRVNKLPAEPDNAAEIVQADVLDDGAVNSAIAGADAVFNLVGILTETAPQTYRAIRSRTRQRLAVRAVFPRATIVRPSLTFGEGDHFFSRLAVMIRISPVLPLIGAGTTKFQPVFIDDMTAGLLEILKRSETAGQTYEFGGPQVYSFKMLLELLLTALNRQRVLLPIPFALGEMQAACLSCCQTRR